jgi:hypothetical protein
MASQPSGGSVSVIGQFKRHSITFNVTAFLMQNVKHFYKNHSNIVRFNLFTADALFDVNSLLSIQKLQTQHLPHNYRRPLFKRQALSGTESKHES